MSNSLNMLITSAGRRTRLLDYFKQEFQGIGNVIAADCSSLAPTLYASDRSYVVPRIDNGDYMESILDICRKEAVKGIVSLIDPELSLLGRHEERLRRTGVTPFVSPFGVSETCLDKYAMYQFCESRGFNCPKTYSTVDSFEQAYRKGEIAFPVFIKPRKGSGSAGVNKVYDMDELKLHANRQPHLLIQQFMSGEEYGIDVYVDLLTGEVVSIFAKKKIAMRSGETDKAVSIQDNALFEFVETFVRSLGIRGPADIDLFLAAGHYYIMEVNPRFGGGYPLAYECGCNFPRYMLNNLSGRANEREIGNYQEGVYMIKHDTLTVVMDGSLIQKSVVMESIE